MVSVVLVLASGLSKEGNSGAVAMYTSEGISGTADLSVSLGASDTSSAGRLVVTVGE